MWVADTYRSTEMRHTVTQPVYRLMKAVHTFLSYLTATSIIPTGSSPSQPCSLTSSSPSLTTSSNSVEPFTGLSPAGWLPLYTMVTFRADIPYSAAKRRAELQTRRVMFGGWILVLSVLGLGLAWSW